MFRPADRRRPARPVSAGRRVAFTTIELLVVIGIIATLLSLAIGASLAFVTSAREAATRATLAKVDGKLQRRLAALRRSTDRGTGDSSRVGRGVVGPLGVKTEQLRKMPAYLVPRPGADGILGTDDDLAPLSEGDDLTGRALNGNAPQGPFAAAEFAADPTASSEALLLFLTSGESYGSQDTDEDAFKESELADTDGDGLREIIDGFGNPLRFYRWPTRLMRPALDGDGDGVVDSVAETGEASAQGPNGRWPLTLRNGSIPAALSDEEKSSAVQIGALAAALYGGNLPPREFGVSGETLADADPGDPYLPTLGSTLRSDPDDPQALVGQEFALRYAGGGFVPGIANLSDAAVATTADEFEQLFHTPTTYFAPIVVSAGADGVLGLYEPQDRANFGHLAQPRDPVAALDNLTNLQAGF